MVKQTVIGIDIGGTKIKAGRFHDDQPQRVVEYPTPQTGGADVIALLIDICLELQTDTAPAAAIGIGAAGLIDTNTGTVIGSTENIAGWLGTEIYKPLTAKFGMPVAVDNDVNVFALGEMTYGAGRGYDSALCVAIGTGVGGAIVFQNKVWSGAGYSAGEAGYLFAGMLDGKPSLLEYRAGGRAMELTYQQRANLSERLSLREVSRRAIHENDELAATVITEGASLLGYSLGSVLTFFDPEVFIVGGGIPEIGELWWTPFLAAIESSPLRSARSADIKRAELGTDAVMLGAVALAQRALV